jgi:hypothetical protein
VVKVDAKKRLSLADLSFSLCMMMDEVGVVGGGGGGLVPCL